MKLETLPIAVYCTEQKKCVMIFNSTSRADKYIFATLKYSTSRTRYLVQNKGKTNKNVFEKTLAFRYANVDQKEILGDDSIVILDEEFVRHDICKNNPHDESLRTYGSNMASRIFGALKIWSSKQLPLDN